MEKIKLILVIGGVIFWVFAILIPTVYLLDFLWQQWQKFKYRTWIFQVYEYCRVKRLYKKHKLNNFTDKNLNWYSIKQSKEMFDGKITGLEYRKRNLFRKKYIAINDEMLNSEGFKQFQAEC